MSAPLPLPGRRDLLIGGAALATAALAAARMPRDAIRLIGKNQLDRLVPLTIGSWAYDTASGFVLPPPDQLARLLYDQQLTRSYSSPDQLPVMLLLAYGSSQGGMLQIHRPEVCYPASGFHLSETQVGVIALDHGRAVPCRSFVAQGDTRTEHVLYWTRIGDLVPTSWTGQRLAVIRNNLGGTVPDGLLVRMSTIAGNAAQAQAALQTFARTWLQGLPLPSQRMLIGSAAGSR